MLVEAGIRAIWNFAPVHLNVPEHIIVQNENLAASLAVLSKQLTEKIKGNQTE
jgi:redox-sensing transcriptional repressor